MDHPVDVQFTSSLKRSRLKVFFRGVLAIPHAIYLALYGIPAGIVQWVMLLAAIFMGRTPEGMWNYLHRYQQYSLRVSAYYYYLTESFPPFNGTDPYEVDLVITPPEGYRQGRLGVFFRTILAIPSIIIMYGYMIAFMCVMLVAWFAMMFTGKIPVGMQLFMERALTYMTRLQAYISIMTNVKPAFVDKTAQRTPDAV